MGYSPRYHVASLAAVFFALAIGIVIGVGFGDNVASDATRELEESLQADLDEARSDVDALESDLSRERDFARRAYPALVGGRLRGERVGLISIGPLSADVASDVEAALEPTGATLAAVAVVERPPARDVLADAVGGNAFKGMRRDDEALKRYGVAVGSQLARGGGLLRRTSNQLFSRRSGRFGNLDALIVARAVPDPADEADEAGAGGGGDEPDPTQNQAGDGADALEAGLLEGLGGIQAPTVGVERSSDDDSSVGLYEGAGIPSVDNIDQTAGRVAAVFVLLGAEGRFGIKSSADNLLPDLLFDTSGVRGVGSP